MTELAPASLPAVPANLGFLITMLKEKAISLFVARDRRAESEKEEAEYLASRSHLENLFLEQQREIERLRPSVATETAEARKIEHALRYLKEQHNAPCGDPECDSVYCFVATRLASRSLTADPQPEK